MKQNYRPQKFQEVCGQKAIVQTLMNAIKMGRVANAYLFTGSRGTGKTTLARILAKALNCEHLDQNGEPCGTCQSCKEICESRSLDVLEIDGASNRGIDDIRNINDTVSYATRGKCKVYIIDEVHMLTKEAFNALLKTLEEPPENVRFFFATTEPHKVLPTIISRCQRFDLKRIPDAEIITKLKSIAEKQNIKIEDDALFLLTHLAEGGLRDAESLLDQMACFTDSPITRSAVETILGLTPQEDFLALDKATEQHDLPFAFTLAEKVFSSGRDLSHFLTSLAEHYRKHLHNALAENAPTHQLFYILDYLMPWLDKMNKTPFKQFHLEIILLHIIRSSKRIPIDALVEKLEAMRNTPQALPTPAVQVTPPPIPTPQATKPPESVIPTPQTIKPPAPVALEPQATKIPEPIATPKPPEPKPPAAPLTSSAAQENLIRFASVELNGTVQK